jgi:serine/threonine protein kinase
MGHFKLLNIIGTGGMGAVYKGLDLSLERNVAVKVIREEFARNPQAVESFLREARAAAALNHPNVAQIYSFGEQGNRYYLVMELLPHGSLDDRIEKEHRLPELDVLEIGSQVASGLQAAHERGLIHRDIKPGNILFTVDGTAKVVDFGLARLERKAAQSDEGIWGTPYYIAPEKVSSGMEDFRSDIYSLGGTLFHALAGRAPFEAGTSVEIVEKHLRSPAVSLRAFCPDITPQAVEVISRMLKRDPQERHQSYEELLNDFAYAKRFALDRKAPEKIEVEGDFPPSMIITTVLIVLVTIGAAAYLWTNRDRYFGIETKPPIAPMKIDKGGGERPSDPVVANKNSTSQNPSSNRPGGPSGSQQTAKPSRAARDYPAFVESAFTPPPGGQQDWTRVLGKLNAMREEARLESPQDPGLLNWLNLHIARVRMLLKQDPQQEIQFLIRSEKPQSITVISDEKLPQVFAFILSGQMSADEFEQRRANSKIPAWVDALASFDFGLETLRSGGGSNREKAEQAALVHWNHYLEKEAEVSASVRWPSAFKVFAREMKAFDALRSELNLPRRLKEPRESDFTFFRDLFLHHQNKWKHQEIMDGVSGLRSRVSQKYTAYKEEIAHKAKADYQAKVESEQKLMEDTATARQPLMAAYSFEEIFKVWKSLEPRMATPESRRNLESQLATYQLLTELKSRIAADVALQPYDKKIVTRQNSTITGKLKEVSGDRLYFVVDFGEISCRWGDLLPTTVLDVGDFYLKRLMNTPGSDKVDIARRALALAAFAREYKLQRNLVEAYLGIAEKSGADVIALRNKLFPQS